MTEEKKDSKKCSGKKNIMFAYGLIQLGSSFVSAIALAAIAFGFCSLKKESKLFNKCVAEIVEDGGTNSEAVRYCNCLLYTSPSPRDGTKSRMPSSA